MRIRQFKLFSYVVLLILFSSAREYGNNIQAINELIVDATNSKLPYQERFNKAQFAENLVLKQTNMDSIHFTILFQIAGSYIKLKKWNNLLKINRIILLHSARQNNKKFVGMSYRCFGIYYERQSKNDSAFYFYKKAEKIFTANKNIKYLCQTYQNIAQVKNFTNDFLGSEQSLVAALKIAKANQYFDLEAEINYSLGISSTELGEYETAKKYYRQSMLISLRNKDTLSYLIACNSLGYNYFKSEDVVKSISFFNNVLTYKVIISSFPDLKAMALDNLGYSYFKLNNFSQLPAIYLKSAQIRDSLHIEQGKNFNRLYLSEYYAAIRDSAKARLYAHEAYEISKSFRAPKDILLCLRWLTKVEPSNALSYSQRYIQISDSMQKMERETRNKFAKIAYETEEITKEKEDAIQDKQTISASFAAILIALLLVTVIFYQRYRQKELVLVQHQHLANEEIFQLVQSQQLKIDQGREIEKKRIARDLHDGVMNKLSSTRFNLHILEKSSDPETINKCLNYINSLHDIEKEIRNISHNLNSDVLAGKDSFKLIIETLLEQQEEIVSGEWHTEVDEEINWDAISNEVKVHIYRILQEAIQNINKHAFPNKIIISLISNSGKILLEIYDDGVGFSLNGRKKGIGLQNIYARVKSCNGTITIDTNKGKGTNMTIALPYNI